MDEIHEVIPITESYNVWHPQEGVLTGHFSPSEIEKINKIAQLREGVSKVIEDAKYSPDPIRKYVVADMITGYGVAEAVKHYYDIYTDDNLHVKRAIIQGWGNVASAAAYYLAQDGVKIVGIIDKEGGLIKEEGFEYNEIRELFLTKNGNKINHPNLMSFEDVNEKIWDLNAEIFIPAAASRLVTKDQIDRMVNSGLEVISNGANVPFADSEIFFGPISEYADSKVSVIPDFIANCGMARVFAYLMQKNADLSDESIFKDTSEIIKNALHDTHRESSEIKEISKVAFGLALKQLI